MDGDDVRAEDFLRRLFSILAEEVSRNPSLASKIVDALPSRVVKISKLQEKKKTFNPLDYHPVNILKSHGENALRGRLLHLNNREKLRAIAKASNLTLEGRAARAKATISELVDGIVNAALHYHRKRTAATD